MYTEVGLVPLEGYFDRPNVSLPRRNDDKVMRSHEYSSGPIAVSYPDCSSVVQ